MQKDTQNSNIKDIECTLISRHISDSWYLQANGESRAEKMHLKEILPHQNRHCCIQENEFFDSDPLMVHKKSFSPNLFT